MFAIAEWDCCRTVFCLWGSVHESFLLGWYNYDNQCAFHQLLRICAFSSRILYVGGFFCVPVWKLLKMYRCVPNMCSGNALRLHLLWIFQFAIIAFVWSATEREHSVFLVALDVCVCVCVHVCVCVKEQFVNYIVLQLLSSLFFHCDLDSTDMYIKMYIEQAHTSGTTPGQICIEKAMHTWSNVYRKSNESDIPHHWRCNLAFCKYAPCRCVVSSGKEKKDHWTVKIFVHRANLWPRCVIWWSRCCVVHALIFFNWFFI